MWRNTFPNKIGLGSGLASVRCPSNLLGLVSCYAHVGLPKSQTRVGEHSVNAAYCTECVQTLPVDAAEQASMVHIALVHTQANNQMALTATAIQLSD